MSTPHNKAKKGEIAKTVLMPGDPLRAKFIADNYLENVKMFNDVRNMYGCTGTYKGKEVSVMGSGMGMPSIGIYSYELYSQYDVENIIRIGTCGANAQEVKLLDVILADSSYSLSTFAQLFDGTKDINELYNKGKYTAFDFQHNTKDYYDCYGETETHGPLWIRPDGLKKHNIYKDTKYYQVVSHTMDNKIKLLNDTENIFIVDVLAYTKESLIIDINEQGKIRFEINKK